MEILSALRKLGDSLTEEECHFLQDNLTESLKEFNRVTSDSLGKTSPTEQIPS